MSSRLQRMSTVVLFQLETDLVILIFGLDEEDINLKILPLRDLMVPTIPDSIVSVIIHDGGSRLA